METIKVRAVEGRMLPLLKRPGDFVGYVRCESAEAEHVVPGGVSYKRADGVDVPNTRYYRVALRRGDIELDKPEPKSAAKKGG